jgi:hypothetical protein
MMVAIDGNTKLVYEGESYYGYGLWPTPVLSLATLIADADSITRLPPGSDLLHADMVFREDSFDPVTRIRRGRLYKTPGSQPQQWRVTPHSFLPSQGPSSVWLHGFDSNFIASIRASLSGGLIALGTRDAYTLWRVVDVERIVTGEDLLTLRARASLGLLPELNAAAVPSDARGKVEEALAKLSEAAHRAGPESIVDRARDVAQWVIGSWLGAQSGDSKLRLVDLWEVAGKVSETESAVVRNVGRSLARLHARNKPNVQEGKSTRPVTEDDAEYALAAVGMLLREVGWAK